jgi:uncharacterized membrane protein YfcA
MDYLQYLIFFSLGLIVSLINSIAGGGSSLSLPIMILLGLPPTVANGTNRIGLIVGNLSSMLNLKKHGYLYMPVFKQLFLPTLIGSFLGVVDLVKMSDKLFQAILALVIFFVVFMTNLKKDILGKAPETPPSKRSLKGFLGFIAIGIYGSIIQVGVGFLQIFAISKYSGLSLIQVNALKSALTSIFLVVSTIGLALSGKILWDVALIMALGAWLGGYIGSSLQRKHGNQFIQRAITIVSLLMACYLLYDLF